MTICKTSSIFRSVIAFSAITLAGSAAYCQLNSNTATVSLTATLAESLTVSASPASASFTLVAGGSATSGAPVAMTTTWIMNRNRASVTLVGWFASAAAALTDGGSPAVNIPTSEVLGQVTTGTPTTFTAFTQTGVLGTAGAGLTMFTQAVNNTNRSGTRTDNLSLKIDLTSQPQLPAGTYTGTLNLQAQAL